MPLDPSHDDFKYWAFISYSHSDEKWAEWIHSKLETYKVPKHLVGKPTREGIVPARAYPVFRDRDELPGSANLGDNIESALRLSRYLIVICSPRAVHSKWVDKEIRIFKSWGREDRVLCLVVDGEPHADQYPGTGAQECLPAAIRYVVNREGIITDIPTEPIAADARRGKDGKHNALLKLLAGILGVNYSELKDRSQERRERQWKAIAAGVFALLLIFSTMGVAFYFQKNEALNAKRIAEQEKEVSDANRLRAEEATKEARDALAKEIQAKEEAEAARRRVEKSVEAERAAKEAAVQAREKEAQAHQMAEEARVKAEKQELEIRHTLSLSDVATAAKLVEEKNEPKALAYLSRALRYDSENPAVLARMLSLLSQRNWLLPVVEPLKHDNEVRSAAFSPNGKWVVTVSGNSASVWNAATGKPLFQPLQHRGKVNSVVFSPDSRRVLTASDDDTAQLWDVETGKKINEPFMHNDSINAAVFSRDGKWIATVSKDKTARVWNAETGQAVTEPLPHDGPVYAVIFQPDGRAIVTTSPNTARIWEVATGQPTGIAMKHDGGVYCVDVSPNGRYIATGSGDRMARVWDAVTGAAVGQPMRHDNWVFSVQFSPDNRQLLTASSDGTARLWDVPSCTQAVPPFKHESGVNVARFGPRGRRLITASADGTARVWDSSNGQPASEPMRHMGGVHDACFSPDGLTVVTASADHTAKIWTAVSGKPVVQRLKHDQPVNGAAFSPDGKWVATISSDWTARVWDVSKGKPVTDPIKHRRRPVAAMAFSPDGKLLATASEDLAVHIWEVNSGTSIHPKPLQHDGQIRAVNFSPDGKWLVSASSDKRARIWDVATGAPLVEPLKHDGEVTSAFFSPDGKWVITASTDRKARVWVAATGQLVSTMIHVAEVRALAISPDGKWIATGADDKTARIWDAVTGNPLTEPIQHDSVVHFVAFNPVSSWNERRWLLTSSEKVARLWEADSAKAVTEPITPGDSIQAISFNPTGDFLVIASGNTARVWDNTGKPVTDPLLHDGAVRSASFSPDGNFVVTASADRAARLWPFTISSAAPAWLGDLANAICGYRLDNFGAAELLPNAWNRLMNVNSTLANAPAAQVYVAWGKWFLADRSTRTLSAFATTPVGEYVRERVEEGTPGALNEVLDLEPNNALALAKVARLSKNADEAEFLSKLAETYEPANPEVLWERAQVLQQWDKLIEAWEVMERAIKLDPKNIVAFGPEGSEVNCANMHGATSKGWLPKGWSDANSFVPFNVTYVQVAEVPKTGLNGIEIKVDGAGTGSAEVRGPRFICRRTSRCTIEGWLRSANRADLTVLVSQFVEPSQKYREQIIHSTAEWKPFKIQFSPTQDIAAELRLLAPVGGAVQLAGVSIKTE